MAAIHWPAAVATLMGTNGPRLATPEEERSPYVRYVDAYENRIGAYMVSNTCTIHAGNSSTISTHAECYHCGAPRKPEHRADACHYCGVER